MVEPTANEQLMLELVNRARLDPAGEASLQGISLNKGLGHGTIKPSAKQPLAMNTDLLEAARAHSNWMLDRDIFDHTGAGGSSPGDRMADAGYVFTGSWTWGENIAWRGTTGAVDLTSFIIAEHNDLFHSPGHRENMLNGSFREIGIGQGSGAFKGYNGSMVTQDFAKSGTSVFVTGVMYDDKNGNDFYSVGEGQSGIAVSVAGHSTASLSAGGYQIKAPSGFVMAEFGSAITFKVDTSKGNAKVDLVDGSILDSSASLELVSGIHHARLLGIGKAKLTGSKDGDWLEGNGGRNRIRGEDGNDTLKGGNGRDKLFGDDGNDVLKAGSGKDKLDGGAGSDVLKGGKGCDTFIFKHGLIETRVLDFHAGHDKLDFGDFFGSAKAALAAAHDHSGSAVFDLPGGDHVTLKGVSVSHLSVDDFL